MTSFIQHGVGNNGLDGESLNYSTKGSWIGSRLRLRGSESGTAGRRRDEFMCYSWEGSKSCEHGWARTRKGVMTAEHGK